MHFSFVYTILFECSALVISDMPCFVFCFCDVRTRLLLGNFIVNKDSVYKTHEGLWDGEI